MKEVRTKVNSTLTLECECWAMPPPTITWYKDGQVSEETPGSPASAWNLPEKAVRALLAPEPAWALPHFVFY